MFKLQYYKIMAFYVLYVKKKKNLKVEGIKKKKIIKEKKHFMELNPTETSMSLPVIKKKCCEA